MAGVMAGIAGLGTNAILWLGLLMAASLAVSVIGLQAARHGKDASAQEPSRSTREVLE